MRQKTWFMPIQREVPAEAEAASHRLLLRAGFIRQLAAGVYTYLPMGRRVLRKLETIIREELDRIGAQELLMPALQPAELWEQSGRLELYGPELIRLQDRHGRAFALGPTHEEIVTALAGAELRSYRRLPLLVYQIQTKFRDEPRPRFGLLRGREFLMKDAYSFHAEADTLHETYEHVRQAYGSIFTRVGLRFRAIEADNGAIGGEGGSHEFVALADIGEDTVVTCSECDYAANLEKLAMEQERDVQAGDPCPRCTGRLQFSNGIEIAHVFKLGTRYSEPLQARVADASGVERPHLMGCYGIGVSRLLATIVEQHHDADGIVWPAGVAPYHVHLVPLQTKPGADAWELAHTLYERLQAAGVEVLLDDREERPGVKLKDADLIGLPVRIVIGRGAADGRVEWKARADAETMELSIDEVIRRLDNLG
ncbi:proline--tRNA ligase [Paenibacillus sp. HJGM_3]|uniref:proline--tRNA ligase n=1 Tax=Paenibacillus sp. HJGM_3 TaxID=3379816 RepID=UPI00385E96D8